MLKMSNPFAPPAEGQLCLLLWEWELNNDNYSLATYFECNYFASWTFSVSWKLGVWTCLSLYILFVLKQPSKINIFCLKMLHFGQNILHIKNFTMMNFNMYNFILLNYYQSVFSFCLYTEIIEVCDRITKMCIYNEDMTVFGLHELLNFSSPVVIIVIFPGCYFLIVCNT